jgi:hypothetical protein
MAEQIKMQKTEGVYRETQVYEDAGVYTVYVDGVLMPDAVIDIKDGVYRVSTHGDTVIDINAYPPFMKVIVKHVPGWQGKTGWSLRLIDAGDDYDPGVTSLALYDAPSRKGNYLYTVGAMQHFPDEGENGLWGWDCPAGHEQGEGNDVNFSFLYASLAYSYFTLFANEDERVFTVGGDAPVAPIDARSITSISIDDARDKFDDIMDEVKKVNVSITGKRKWQNI